MIGKRRDQVKPIDSDGNNLINSIRFDRRQIVAAGGAEAGNDTRVASGWDIADWRRVCWACEGALCDVVVQDLARSEKIQKERRGTKIVPIYPFVIVRTGGSPVAATMLAPNTS